MDAESDVADVLEEGEVIIIEHPPEDVVKTSGSVVLAGFCLIVALIILMVFLWASRGEKDGKPDAFGKYVKVRDVSERYKSSWTPGKFWPSNKEHSYKGDGSPLFKVVWFFLIAWLFISGWFLVLAGALASIEVFREDAHLRAAGCVSAAICLCAVWPLFFRIGSYAKGHEPIPVEKRDPRAPLPREEPYNSTRGVFLWLAFALLFIAAILATAGSGTLRAWTLPGPQYGTLLFLGPGYGLFAGWLWFAASLNCSVAISHASYPAGTVAKPDTNTSYTHRPSIWPIAISVVLLLASLAALDPAIPIPAFIALFFFTPKNMTHLIACFVCVLSVGVTSFLVANERG